jgi:hypothetical protein
MEIVQPPGAGTPGVTEEAPRPPLRDQGIGDGKVACLRATHRQVKERFIGPLAGRVNRQAIGRINRSPASRG